MKTEMFRRLKLLQLSVGAVVLLFIGSGILVSGCATSDSTKSDRSGPARKDALKRVVLGESMVEFSLDQKNMNVLLALPFMEHDLVKQGVTSLTRLDYENRIRKVLQNNNIDLVTLRYKDDNTVVVVKNPH